MDGQIDLKEILKKDSISSELELEQALILDRKLRLLVKELPELAVERDKLRSIIQTYENHNWNSNIEISEQKIIESDHAEINAEQERQFLEIRKQKIKNSIDKFGLTQQDLAKLLGHGKSYMSELINGISPFSHRDLIILHRLFDIKLEYLVPTVISEKDRKKLKESLLQLNKPELKLEKIDILTAG